jgi:hypothetical protein
MMVNEYGKIQSDFRFNCELILHGMVTGTVTVAYGGVLILRGMICKDLIVE